MKIIKNITTFGLGCLMLIQFSACSSEQLNADEVLNRSIAFHDPDSNWVAFNADLIVKMESPGRSDRISNISIDLPGSFFRLNAVRDSITTTYEVYGDSCAVKLNSKSEFTIEEIETYRLTFDRAKMYRDYYTYLYGLPMKLKDPGTLINPDVSSKEFKGKTYDVIEVKYDAEVGSDIWYFYFDPETYALEVYQFFKTDENRNIIEDSGEYILLSGLEIINGISMPKVRAWYYNKDDVYLGTDYLNP